MQLVLPGKGLLKSLRFQIGSRVILIVLPLLLMLIYGNQYATNVVLNQVALSNKNLITLYVQQIDQYLTEADNYLYSMMAKDTDLTILNLSGAAHNQDYQMAKIRLNNQLTADIVNYRHIDSFFVYSLNNDDLLTTDNREGSFDKFQIVKTEIKKALRETGKVEAECLKLWCVRDVGSDFYLVHIAKNGNVYIGAWINVEKLMVPMQLVNFGKSGAAVLTSSRYEPIANRDFIRDKDIALRVNQDRYVLSGQKEKYLVVGTQSKASDFYLFAVTPRNEILEDLPYLQYMIMAIVFGSVIVAGLFLLMLRQTLLKPLNRILYAMRRIREGNWDTHLEEKTGTNEFELMNVTFNSMVSQIRKLKIDVYEEQIIKHKTELKLLQMQINPHFYLNSLNIVYHLARAGKIGLIEELVLCLVEYFRFVFRSNEKRFVTIREEMYHVSNYLRIQEMRFPGLFAYETVISDKMLDVPIPPLLLQPFVENTIKYTVSPDKKTKIAMIIESFDDQEVLIRITDTGPGFPEDVLRRLESGHIAPTEDGGHIGIWNVIRRLDLLYGGKAEIRFSNGDQESEYQGATIDISIPVNPDME